MGYSGETFPIDCSKGGLTGNKNIDSVDPNDMLADTRNINLNENGRGKRGGTSHVSMSKSLSSSEITGVYDFRLVDGTQNLMICKGNDGGIHGSQKTGVLDAVGAGGYFSFETFEDTLFITNGLWTPQTWNGTASTTTWMTSIPTDWTTYVNNPSQFIKHGRGVSERLWAVGFKDTPYNVYASANGDGEDFSDANTIVTAIETGDGFGIVGGMEFNDNLFCFGKRKTYVIDDSDIDTANWGYDAASWEGGVAHWRLLIKTPSDMVAMQEDGEIYSVRAAQEYGDYQLASLTRPSMMHNYIKEYINLKEIKQFHGVYDPSLRAIKIFCVRKGQTTCDAAMVYYIDRGPKDGWVIHDNRDFVSGYSAACSAVIRVGTGDYQVYTGGYSGKIWSFNKEDKNDNSEAYYGGFKTPVIDCGDPRIRKNFKRVWIYFEPVGSHDLEVDWWVDGVKQSTVTVDMAGVGGLLGSFTLGTDILGGDDVFAQEAVLGQNGTNIQFEIYNETENEEFFISKIVIDYKPLGKEPAE
jgi:hypothetical protein